MAKHQQRRRGTGISSSGEAEQLRVIALDIPAIYDEASEDAVAPLILEEMADT